MIKTSPMLQYRNNPPPSLHNLYLNCSKRDIFSYKTAVLGRTKYLALSATLSLLHYISGLIRINAVRLWYAFNID